MRYINKILLVLSLALGQQIGMAQECNENIAPTTPDERFVDRGDGTVQDKHTGLIWMRCSLGQTWDGAACTADASVYKWQQALQAANGFTFAGSDAWRMPNVNELKSIVEGACYDPAINLKVFPVTPSSDFWTASSDAHPNHYGFSLSVSFHYGSVYYYGKDSYHHVRLVRPDSN